MSLLSQLSHMTAMHAAFARLRPAGRYRAWMRLNALRYRRHSRYKDQFDQAELALGNAIGYRDLALEAESEQFPPARQELPRLSTLNPHILK